jgi:hypothetical protein
MENKNQMQIGTWERISTESFDDKAKIKFEVNLTQKVVVLNPIPKELTGEDGGVYYIFEVEQEKLPKIIQTSAWTLLRELKKCNLKAGMVLDITKRLAKGKQFFEVKEVK